MCKFHSSISDGKGNVKFFTPQDIVNIMTKEKKEDIDFNSHSQIGAYFNINGIMYDRWNKWEYNPETKELKADTICTDNDEKQVKRVLASFFKDKDILYLKNMYNRNSGYRNSGDMNSGYRNSGDMNSGDMNSGNRNSGYRNSGNMNSGDMNSGNMNSGNMNSGNRNSGYMNSGDMNSCDMNSGNRNSGYRNSSNMNSGDMNSGNRNSGDMNSGDMNSGNMNSGNWNSGNWNSGNMNSGNWNSGNRNSGDINSKTVIGSYCSDEIYYLFNKPCTKEEYEQQYKIDMLWLKPCEWIDESKMTEKEKKDNHNYCVVGGYLKTIDYKQAWEKCPKDVLKEIKNLPNFDKKVFYEITGVKV